MKNLFQIASLALILGMVSCSTIEEQQPSTDLVVTEINKVLDFSDGNSFKHNIDINNDGTVDFSLVGIRGVQPGMGQLNMVRLISTTVENRSIGAETYNFQACDVALEYNSMQILSTNDMISPTESNWKREPLLYVHMITPSDCSHHVKHFESNKEGVLGVKFLNEGYLFYGYIRLRADDLTESGCPGSAEEWTIIEYGYNKVQGQGFMIK